MLPIAFAAIAIIAAAASVALRVRPRWSAAARVCSAGYAVVAPATGFLVLASQTHHGYVGDTPFYETALYESSTLALALAGALALGAAIASQRRWVVLPASAVLTVALLLQIGRFNPENAQAYTAVLGAYFLLAGLLGLWKFRLVPELAEAAPVVEALGAAIIMLPSMVQSLDVGGGRYEWLLLAEAAAFFTSSIVLRRRGLLSAAKVALVLVAGRVLFDAVNALPNWVVVMLAGMALLGIGMGILLGRERWGRWQEALLGWWAHGEGAAVP
jgi:multisubunit Na+/H+ antiporter MnhG subunit